MNKELSAALFDIEYVLFGLEEISNAICIFRSTLEDELDLTREHLLGGSPAFKDRMDQIMSVLTLSQNALTARITELSEAFYKAHELAKSPE